MHLSSLNSGMSCSLTFCRKSFTVSPFFHCGNSPVPLPIPVAVCDLQRLILQQLRSTQEHPLSYRLLDRQEQFRHAFPGDAQKPLRRCANVHDYCK